VANNARRTLTTTPPASDKPACHEQLVKDHFGLLELALRFGLLVGGAGVGMKMLPVGGPHVFQQKIGARPGPVHPDDTASRLLAFSVAIEWCSGRLLALPSAQGARAFAGGIRHNMEEPAEIHYGAKSFAGRRTS
jgi:hypothetical protein